MAENPIIKRGVTLALDLAKHWFPGIPLSIVADHADELIKEYKLEMKCGAGDITGESHAIFQYDGETLRLKRTWMGRYELYHGEWEHDPHWTGD